MSYLLTKSNFMSFMECPCKLWLEKIHKELMPPVDAKTQNLFDQGNEVDSKAQELFPGGVTVEGFNFQGYENTKKALGSDADVLYQPTIVIDGLSCRADILVRNGDGWDLHEVKMSTKMEAKHFNDVTFQTICFEKAGVKINKVFLTYINNQYIKKGEIDLQQLFINEEVTAEVETYKPRVAELIPQAKAVLEWGDKLQADHIAECEHKRECEWTGIWAETLSEDERGELFCNFKEEKKKLPPVHIDNKAIKKEIESLEYPLYFFDYETVMRPIPVFEGHRSYQQVPFQFSVYVVEYEGATPELHDFLMETYEDPIPPLLEAFREVIGPTGTVISWYAPFEKGRNEEMAKMYPEYAELLKSVNDRTYDLYLIFKKGMYIDPACGGSNSIKHVLPALCPDLSYKNLNIQDGGTASASWKVLTNPNLSEEEHKKLYRDMIDYCRLDVYGMVKILDALKKSIK